VSNIEKVFLAVDLGASGGRVLAGRFDGRRLCLEQIHRFDNGPVVAADNMYWDLLAQWGCVKRGLGLAGGKYSGRVTSVGVDTWGVDFGLLGRNNELLGNPYHYRDRRTQGMMAKAFQLVGREEIFAETGIQFMELNTLYQLLAMQRANSVLLEQAESLLMMPDLFHWLMTGEKSNELTNATTTQFYNPRAGGWATGMLERLGMETHFLGPIVPPGTRLGTLRTDVADEIGLAGAEVVLPGTHDTASAVMAVPAAGSVGPRPDWCYISSGTWSLMGVETSEPVISEKSCELNFTNEGGVGGTTRLLKNIAGLWLVQECRRIWQQAGSSYDWGRLVALAEDSSPLVSLIDPDDPSLVAPSDMPDAIRSFCRGTGQVAPDTHGAVIRCALESLALRYRSVLESLEGLTGGRLETIHIVGGGAQNELLCQLAADACRRPVVAGPIEATAIGNLMVQAITAGDVGSIAQARSVIRESFRVKRYEPQDADPWDEAFARFQGLTARAETD
jgi:rhamnulokinase